MEGGNWTGGVAIIITKKDFHIISIRPDDGDGADIFLQWQEVVFIFKQDNRFTGCLQSQFPVLSAIIHLIGYPGIGHLFRRIEHAKLKPGPKQASQGNINFFFGNQPFFNRL
ncbi:hypothetical protein ES703_20436 [subsurface metagenome]